MCGHARAWLSLAVYSQQVHMALPCYTLQHMAAWETLAAQAKVDMDAQPS